MKEPFFSVVMPVYKVEKYLKKAVDSVLKQTFESFELILVDDASPDGSPAICDKLSADDERIKVIHLEKNGGVSNARNVGMKIATGQYLFFMDSDDYIDKELFESAKVSLEKNPAQIVFFGMEEEYYDCDGKLIESTSVVLPEKYFKDQNSLRHYMIQLEKATLYGYACNKFYDLRYLRRLGIRYREYALNEDILFNIAFCRDIDRMNVLDIPAYHYRKSMNKGSRTSQYVREYFELHVKKIQALVNQYIYWGMYTEEIHRDLAAIYTRYIMSALQRNCDPQSKMTLKKRIRWIKKLYRQDLFQDLIPFGQPKNIVVHIFHWCLKYHRTFMILFLGRIIYIVKNRMPGVFYVVQKNR